MEDYLFVIRDNPSSLEELEQDKQQFDSMSYKRRRLSNDLSIEKYGENNDTRYNRMKAKFIKTIPPEEPSSTDEVKPDNDDTEISVSTDVVQEASVDDNLKKIDGFISYKKLRPNIFHVKRYRAYDGEKHKEDWLYISNDDGILVGHAMVIIDPKETVKDDGGELYSLTTDKKYRGHGYATQLLICAVNDLGVKYLSIKKSDENGVAHKLYLKLGFKEYERNNSYVFLKINGKISENKYIKESTISSSIDNDYKSKGRLSLSKFTKIKITDDIIKKYKSSAKYLSHFRVVNGYEGYIWIEDDNVVAACNVNISKNEIQAIEVTSKYQGYGLSKQILDVCVKELKGYKLSVNKSNEVAIRLYDKYGFITYKEDKYMYYKVLSSKSNIIGESTISTSIDNIEIDSEDVWNYKLHKARIAEHDGMIIMVLVRDDLLPSDYTMEDLDTLTDKYNDFLMLNSEKRQLSNDTALNIFGMDNYNLYQTICNAILQRLEAEEMDVSDAESYGELIKTNESVIDTLLHKMDIEYEKDNLLFSEAVHFENIINSVPKDNIDDYVPQMTPFFTPDEMENFGVFSGEINMYADKPDNSLMDDQTPVIEWFRNYKRSNGFMENERVWYTTLRRLYETYDRIKMNGTQEELDARKQSILELGWNPELPFTPKLLSEARIRVSKYIKNNLPEIIDVKKYYNESKLLTDKKVSDEIMPVYIVLSYTRTFVGRIIKTWIRSEYAHIAMGFTPELSNLYTFNISKGKDKKIHSGFTKESLKYDYAGSDKNIILVNVMFVTRAQYTRMKDALAWFTDHREQTTYAIDNLFKIAINKSSNYDIQMKMVCSQFVDSIFRLANIKLSDKKNSLVTPADIERAKNPRIFTVYEGSATKYDSAKVRAMVDDLKVNIDPTIFAPVWSESNIDDLLNAKTIYELKTLYKNRCKYGDELMDLLTAKPVLLEGRFPLRLSGDDLVISKKRNIEEDLYMSHKDLELYAEENDIESIKNELARQHLIKIILNKKIHMLKTKKKQSKKDLEKIDKYNYLINEKIVKDRRKYIGIIHKVEPSFTFSKYYETSRFYDGDIQVDTKLLPAAISAAEQIAGTFSKK